MITAKEARYRVENAQAIKELEENIEFSILTAVENGNFKVGVYVSKKVGERGIEMTVENLKQLGYKVEYTIDNHLDGTIFIEW